MSGPEAGPSGEPGPVEASGEGLVAVVPEARGAEEAVAIAPAVRELHGVPAGLSPVDGGGATKKLGRMGGRPGVPACSPGEVDPGGDGTGSSRYRHAMRRCLRCEEMFDSPDCAHRICPTCAHSEHGNEGRVIRAHSRTIYKLTAPGMETPRGPKIIKVEAGRRPGRRRRSINPRERGRNLPGPPALPALND